PQALIETLYNLEQYQATAVVQDASLATYAKKLSKEEAQLNWHQPAAVLERWVRAFNPWPICWLTAATGEVVTVWQADVAAGTNAGNDAGTTARPGTVVEANKHGIVVQTSKQALRLLELQPPGKKPMAAADFLNGRADWFSSGAVLLSPEHEASL